MKILIESDDARPLDRALRVLARGEVPLVVLVQEVPDRRQRPEAHQEHGLRRPAPGARDPVRVGSENLQRAHHRQLDHEEGQRRRLRVDLAVEGQEGRAQVRAVPRGVAVVALRAPDAPLLEGAVVGLLPVARLHVALHPVMLRAPHVFRA